MGISAHLPILMHRLPVDFIEMKICTRFQFGIIVSGGFAVCHQDDIIF